jgi:hypothetical protein
VHVFHIGPIPAVRGTRVVLVALDTARMLQPVDAPTAAAALKKLQKAAGVTPLVCEPALAEVATECGLSTAPLPEWAVPVQAAMALGLAMGPLGEEHQDVATMIELVDGAVAFMAAKPWEVFGEGAELEVRVEQPDEDALRFRAKLLPNALWLTLQEDGSEAPELVEVLALHVEEPPDFVAEVGLPVLPLPMRLEGSVGRPIGPEELVILLAALGAVSAAATGSDEPRARVELAEFVASAEVSACPPRRPLPLPVEDDGRA